MANCMRACRRCAVKVIVCDRPNPIGGTAVEGPMLVPGFESFVGQFPIPMRHGMTIGELAVLFNQAFGIGCELEVVAMEGWRRSMWLEETGLPWVMTSPNMPTVDTAAVFPGMVLFEGTLLSEGRGTTRPFELVGAPGIDPRRLAQRMNGLKLPGVHFRPTFFEPAFQKHARNRCGGCQLHVTDRNAFEPVRTAVHLLSEIRRHGEASFGWRPPPYEYEAERMPIDILAGSDALRRALDERVSADEIAESWKPEVARFQKARQSCLNYPP
jgi:uncharacterized protein YbbC (DUF1343 family)